MDIPEHAPPRQHKTGRDGPDLFEDIMGKQRREQPQDSIFANNPFFDGLFDWMDSPEGQQSIEVRDVLWNWLEDVQIDAKQRKLIWPDAERLDLEQSIQRVQKKYPDFPRNEVEEFLLDWPGNFTDAGDVAMLSGYRTIGSSVTLYFGGAEHQVSYLI